MGRRRSLVPQVDLDRAQRAHDCKADPRHSVLMGDARLRVKNQGVSVLLCGVCGRDPAGRRRVAVDSARAVPGGGRRARLGRLGRDDGNALSEEAASGRAAADARTSSTAVPVSLSVLRPAHVGGYVGDRAGRSCRERGCGSTDPGGGRHIAVILQASEVEKIPRHVKLWRESGDQDDSNITEIRGPPGRLGAG